MAFWSGFPTAFSGADDSDGARGRCGQPRRFAGSALRTGSNVSRIRCRVNRCIRQIRAALNDDADTPKYIETITRKGYRFIAPLDKTPVETPVFTPEEVPPTVADSIGSRRPVWAAVAVLLLALVVCAVLFFPRRLRLSSNLNSVPLAVSLGDQVDPAFSPDRRQVAFVRNGRMAGQLRYLFEAGRFFLRTFAAHHQYGCRLQPGLFSRWPLDRVLPRL
jgi:hypothetical protein